MKARGLGAPQFLAAAQLRRRFDDRIDILRGCPGGPSPAADFTIRWRGSTCTDARDVVGVGDVNGDGFGDLVVESPAARGWDTRYEVYRGGPAGPPVAPSEVLVGGTEYTRFAEIVEAVRGGPAPAR